MNKIIVLIFIFSVFYSCINSAYQDGQNLAEKLCVNYNVETKKVENIGVKEIKIVDNEWVVVRFGTNKSGEKVVRNAYVEGRADQLEKLNK